VDGERESNVEEIGRGETNSLKQISCSILPGRGEEKRKKEKGGSQKISLEEK